MYFIHMRPKHKLNKFILISKLYVVLRLVFNLDFVETTFRLASGKFWEMFWAVSDTKMKVRKKLFGGNLQWVHFYAKLLGSDFSKPVTVLLSIVLGVDFLVYLTYWGKKQKCSNNLVKVI